mgnify:CR=1 FL=1
MSREEFFREWSVDEIYDMVIEGSDTDMIVAQPLPLTDLFHDGREPFKETVIAVKDLAALLNTNTKTLTRVLDSLPGAYQVLDRIGSHGNTFNFYLCSVQVAISGPNGQQIRTPVVRSQVERCN